MNNWRYYLSRSVINRSGLEWSHGDSKRQIHKLDYHLIKIRINSLIQCCPLLSSFGLFIMCQSCFLMFTFYLLQFFYFYINKIIYFIIYFTYDTSGENSYLGTIYVLKWPIRLALLLMKENKTDKLEIVLK